MGSLCCGCFFPSSWFSPFSLVLRRRLRLRPPRPLFLLRRFWFLRESSLDSEPDCREEWRRFWFCSPSVLPEPSRVTLSGWRSAAGSAFGVVSLGGTGWSFAGGRGFCGLSAAGFLGLGFAGAADDGGSDTCGKGFAGRLAVESDWESLMFIVKILRRGISGGFS